MDKENKKLALVTDRACNKAPPEDFGNYFNEADKVLNSTLQSNSADYRITDISSISSIYGLSAMNNLAEVFSQSQLSGNSKSAASNEETVTQTDPGMRQCEQDIAYLDYLLSVYQVETFKKFAREEDEVRMKEMFDVHLAKQNVKKELAELDFEEKFLDTLLELMKFLKVLNNFFEANLDSLKQFESNFEKLSEIYQKVRRFLVIKNIHMPSKAEFEKSLAAELKSMIEMMKSVISKAGQIPIAPDGITEVKLNYKMIEEVVKKSEQLRADTIEYLSIKLATG